VIGTAAIGPVNVWVRLTGGGGGPTRLADDGVDGVSGDAGDGESGC
jgi:hypothetical protein